MKRRAAVIVALATVLAAREAYGEIWHLKSPSKVETEKGSKLELPPGYFLDEETWRVRDEELRRLQEQETRLRAENRALRKSSTDYPWVATGAVGVFGIVVGVFFMATK